MGKIHFTLFLHFFFTMYIMLFHIDGLKIMNIKIVDSEIGYFINTD